MRFVDAESARWIAPIVNIELDRSKKRLFRTLIDSDLDKLYILLLSIVVLRNQRESCVYSIGDEIPENDHVEF